MEKIDISLAQAEQQTIRRLYQTWDSIADELGVERLVEEFDRWRAQRIDDFPTYLFSKRTERL